VLKPMRNFIFVEPFLEASGLIMPDIVDLKKQQMFRVLEVGPGVMNEDGKRLPSGLESGDIVCLFGKVIEICYDNNKHLLALASDVIAVDVRNGKMNKRLIEIPNAV